MCACAKTADQGHKNEEEIVFSIVCACAETADQGLKKGRRMFFSIVCACAETADQGLKNEKEKVSFRSFYALKFYRDSS